MRVIETSSGSVGLHQQEGVWQGLGIFYAEPLQGVDRIRAPKPRQPWQGVLDARSFGSACPQSFPQAWGIDHVSGDCLSLNVWTPQLEGKRAIMVWIHGGGYLAGSSCQSVYHAAALCREQDVVVISINYRLGLCGFSDFSQVEGLQADSNCGIRDVLLALEWVRTHAELLGGDPEQVTLFGQSAGAMLVATLLAVPSAQHLFQRAIVQSGSADHVLLPEVAQSVVDRLSAGVGNWRRFWEEASWDEVLLQQNSCMDMSLPRADYPFADLQFSMPAMPVLDGSLLPELPLRAQIRKPLLIGTCRDEWSAYLWMPQLVGGRPRRNVTHDQDAWHRLLQRGVPHAHETLRHAYDEYMADTDFAERMVAEETDRIFRHSLRVLARQNASVSHVYRLDWSCVGYRRLGACHMMDIPFVFAQEDSALGQFLSGNSPQARQLGQSLRHNWGCFARGESLLPHWPDYREQHEVRIFGEAEQVEAGKDEVVLAMWDSLRSFVDDR